MDNCTKRVLELFALDQAEAAWETIRALSPGQVVHILDRHNARVAGTIHILRERLFRAGMRLELPDEIDVPWDDNFGGADSQVNFVCEAILKVTLELISNVTQCKRDERGNSETSINELNRQLSEDNIVRVDNTVIALDSTPFQEIIIHFLLLLPFRL